EALPLVPVRRDVVHDLESRAVRLSLVAGFVEHLVRDVRAVRQVVVPDVGGVDATGCKVGADRTGGRLAEAEPDVVDDELAIDRDRDRLAHPDVVERLYARVEVELDDRRLHLRAARLRIADEARDDAIEVRLAGAPVFGVAVEAHVLTALPFDELERSGADRIVRVLAVLDVGPGE